MNENTKITLFDLEKQKILEESGVIEFKNRLSLAQEGMSGNAFAKKVGMSEAVIRDYLSGKTYPSLNRLAQIAKNCDISIEWLATGRGECRLLSNTLTTQIVHIPAYQESKSSLLQDETSNTNNKSNTISKIPFDLRCIKTHDFNINDLYVYWAKGDSMAPTIVNNDTIIIDTGHTQLFDGYLYIVEYGDALSIKRIQNHGKYLLLIPDNDKYQSIKIDKALCNQELKIIGKVIAILKDLS